MNVTDKTIVITGAASGIGRALAIECTRRGASIAISDVDEDGLAQTAQAVTEVASAKLHCSTHRLDVADPANWARVYEQVIDQHGTVDGIINNAGITFSGTIEDTPIERLEAVMAINFMGNVYGTKTFLPILKQRPEACIANVSSVFGLYPMKKQSAYCASKFAVAGFTGVLHQELRDTSITVSTVHPGHIATNVVRNAVKAGNTAGVTLPQAHQDYILEAFERNGMPASEAAIIILDGIAQKRRKILVGKDAEDSDQLLRHAPETFIDEANDQAI